MRYNDVRHGRSDVSYVIKNYQEAWEKKGMVQSDGMYINFLLMRQDHIVGANGVNLTAW